MFLRIEGFTKRFAVFHAASLHDRFRTQRRIRVHHMEIRGGIAEVQNHFERASIAQRHSLFVLDRTIRRWFDAGEQQPNFFLTEDLDKANAFFAFDADCLPVYSGSDALRTENEAVDRDTQLQRTLIDKVFRLATHLLQQVVASAAARRT